LYPVIWLEEPRRNTCPNLCRGEWAFTLVIYDVEISLWHAIAPQKNVRRRGRFFPLNMYSAIAFQEEVSSDKGAFVVHEPREVPSWLICSQSGGL
jgi:hypothetical protein